MYTKTERDLFRQARYLGLCQGIMETTLLYLKLHEEDRTANGYWLEQARNRIEKCLAETAFSKREK